VERFQVEVDVDQFEELCRPSQPLAAVAELIWNSLDAEADTVDVVITQTPMGAVEALRVVDNGHGMTNNDALRDFRKLGGSWKRGRKRSKNNLRMLHGQKGQGRFRAFALGLNAEWSSVAEGMSGLERTVISGSLMDSEFTISDPERLATGSPGTIVTITGPRDTSGALLGPDGRHWLIIRLAAYLATYPQITVTYNRQPLDLDSILKRKVEIPLDPSLGGHHGAPVVRIMEWGPEIVSHRSSLILCDENGIALHEITDAIPTGGMKLTAYLTWAGFADHGNQLLLSEMGHRTLSPIISAARQALAKYVGDRLLEERQVIIQQWKARKVYPYDKAPSTAAEIRERQVFDVVAATAAGAVPDDPRAAKLSLRLLKEALEQSPGALHRVLQEVLDLTVEQVADFDRLLRTTSLPAVIAATNQVTDRLIFLDDLSRLLFNADGRKAVRERDQLHEILANGRTWVFGEEYALVASDKTLTKVLDAHLKELGDNRPVMGPVSDVGGSTGRRVDLMLSRAVKGATGRRHLVVELKRPSVVLGQAELGQITNYAIAVARDPAFRAPDVTWDFWLVGDDYDGYIDEMVHQDTRPIGVASQKHPYTVRVRRWAEIIEENRQRLHFYRERLNYQAEDDLSVQETLDKYLPVGQGQDGRSSRSPDDEAA
jgi:Histidine kinase-, DNA gyrase B-, and HSP90-like ATPase